MSDGVRRWTIRYREADGSQADFLSDALTMADALKHFETACPGLASSHIRRLHPDKWLNRL